MPLKYPSNVRIRQFREDRGMTQPQLAEAAGVDLKSIQNYESKNPSRAEVRNLVAISSVLEMPPGAVFADGLLDPVVFLPFERENLARVAEVGRLAQSHLAVATELSGYGEFLPCSLETREFMEQHHLSWFKQRYESHEPWHEIANAFNSVGNNQRKAFDAHVSQWLFTHLMFESKFDEIVDAHAQQYSLVERTHRVACLERLAHLLTTLPHSRLRMHVVLREHEATMRQSFRMQELFGFDSMIVIFNKFNVPVFSFYRRHSGEVGYTDRPEATRKNAQFLDAIIRAATLSGPNLLERIQTMIQMLKATP